METLNNEKSYYIFDIDVLRNRIQYLREHLPQDTGICYAMKANTFITKQIEDYVDRFEICSPGEATICNLLGIDKHKTVISGVYKSPKVIEANLSSERIFTIESMNQYELLKELSEKYKTEVKVLIRLTNDSQFGINRSDVEYIIDERLNTPLLNIIGIQYFSGTQKTSIKRIARELRQLDSFLLDLEEEHGFKAQELEYGPGLSVSYFNDDDYDEEAFLAAFKDLLENMTFKAKITLELGRSIAASCGEYYCHVVDMKTNKASNYLMTDGGMHQLLYFGQHMAMRHPYFHVVGKENEVPEKVWNICGALCSMNDILVKLAPLPAMEIGDTLRFDNAGAYCATEGMSLFLSRDLPAIYLRENGECTLVRPTYETYELNMSIKGE